GGPHFLCIGSLIARKNVVRLARAFERLGEGTLTFVGDGPLRPQLEGRRGVELAGTVPYDAVPARIAAAHVVCQPSLIEPFGQPDLDERTDRLLEPGILRRLEGLLVALPHLLRVDALLEAVVSGDQELLDPLPGVVALHKRTVTSHI